MLRIICAGILYAILSVNAFAFSLATWNAAGASVESIADRKDDVKALGAAYRAELGKLPDVVVLQEITSFAAARKIADYLGYKDATIITSDVGDDREIWPFALEIAVITTENISAVDVFQSLRMKRNKPVPPRAPFIEDQKTGSVRKGNAQEIEIPQIIMASNSEKPSRGVLRVELADLVIYGVHLSSSGLSACRAWQTASDAYGLQKLAESFGLGDQAKAIQDAKDAVLEYAKAIPKEGVSATVDETLKRAKKREAAAAAISILARADVSEGKSVYVAGDFNTPVSEKCKTGTKLAEDATPQASCKIKITPDTCGAVDGYDDTIAIFSKGLAGGPEFSVLTKDLDRTYTKGGFVNSPIDNILAAGPGAQKPHTVGRIEGPKVNGKVFGSDHYSVLAVRD